MLANKTQTKVTDFRCAMEKIQK